MAKYKQTWNSLGNSAIINTHSYALHQSKRSKYKCAYFDAESAMCRTLNIHCVGPSHSMCPGYLSVVNDTGHQSGRMMIEINRDSNPKEIFDKFNAVDEYAGGQIYRRIVIKNCLYNSLTGSDHHVGFNLVIERVNNDEKPIGSIYFSEFRIGPNAMISDYINNQCTPNLIDEFLDTDRIFRFDRPIHLIIPSWHYKTTKSGRYCNQVMEEECYSVVGTFLTSGYEYVPSKRINIQKEAAAEENKMRVAEQNAKNNRKNDMPKKERVIPKAPQPKKNKQSKQNKNTSSQPKQEPYRIIVLNPGVHLVDSATLAARRIRIEKAGTKTDWIDVKMDTAKKAIYIDAHDYEKYRGIIVGGRVVLQRVYSERVL